MQVESIFFDLKALSSALKEKGLRYFARPLGCAAVLLFVFYFYIYAMPRKRLTALDAELEAVRATVKYAGDYQDLSNRLHGFYSRLPKTTEPAAWLLADIRESLRQEGIVPDAFSSPSTEMRPGYRVVSMTVTLNMSYRQLASWMARLENGRYLLHVKDLTLVKKPKPIGNNLISVTLMTVVPIDGSGS
jgi:Tfp pilus assembly protein PilO